MQEFTFDAEGNLTQIVERDNAGDELARTSVAWSPSSVVVSRSGAFHSVQRGAFGEHGELVDWTADSERIHLRWQGTFAPAPTPARFAFETYYHVIGDEPLLPLDTASRGVWPRMRAVVFTGTVVLHRDGTPDTEDDQATYEAGHQIERSIGGRHGRPRITTRTTWRGDDLVDQTSTDGAKRTFSSARGHLTRITGDIGVSFTYDDAGNLTHVRTEYGGRTAIEVELSRCTNR